MSWLWSLIHCIDHLFHLEEHTGGQVCRMVCADWWWWLDLVPWTTLDQDPPPLLAQRHLCSKQPWPLVNIHPRSFHHSFPAFLKNSFDFLILIAASSSWFLNAKCTFVHGQTCQLPKVGEKHRKNCECCPGHSLIVNHYSSMSWFKFCNLSVIVNCVTQGSIHALTEWQGLSYWSVLDS